MRLHNKEKDATSRLANMEKTYSCCKEVNFSISIGNGPKKLFELKLL